MIPLELVIPYVILYVCLHTIGIIYSIISFFSRENYLSLMNFIYLDISNRDENQAMIISIGLMLLYLLIGGFCITFIIIFIGLLKILAMIYSNILGVCELCCLKKEQIKENIDEEVHSKDIKKYNNVIDVVVESDESDENNYYDYYDYYDDYESCASTNESQFPYNYTYDYNNQNKCSNNIPFVTSSLNSLAKLYEKKDNSSLDSYDSTNGKHVRCLTKCKQRIYSNALNNTNRMRLFNTDNYYCDLV